MPSGGSSEEAKEDESSQKCIQNVHSITAD